MTDASKPTCTGTKRDGTPCRSTLNLGPTGRCLMHDPERADAVRAMRSAGGKAPRPPRKPRAATIPNDVPPAPKTLEDATAYSAWLTHAVATGRIDARTAHEAAYALNGFRTGAEKRDLTARLAALTSLVSSIRKCASCAALAADVEGAA